MCELHGIIHTDFRYHTNFTHVNFFVMFDKLYTCCSE